MPDALPLLAFRARWLFPVSGPPLADGLITLGGERIVAVGKNLAGAAPIDLGNVALLPGLINAHTHLEFSALAAPLGAPGEPLPAWIRRVIAWRRDVSPQQASANVQQGLAEALSSGTTSIGEIATGGWPESASPAAEVTVFWESLGFAGAQVDARLDTARRQLAAAWPAGQNLRTGLSPHAPYSVHPRLFAGLVSMAAAAGVPVAMHLAESHEELELLAQGTGPFRELLSDLGIWSADVLPAGTRVLDYLRVLATAPRALAIHGNYLDTEEVAFLAEHAERLALVYCPRTHAYFGHARYPLGRLLQAGVRVALGTDSRASNPDLSLLEELRFVARRFPELPPATILELGTIAGARALGQQDALGSLAPGKLADMVAVPLPASAGNDPYEMLFDSPLPAVCTWRRGRRCGATSGNS